MTDIIKKWHVIEYIIGKEPDPDCEECEGKGWIRRWPAKTKKKGIVRFCSCIKSCKIYKK